MKILWVKTDFLHPTTRGGQIRTLEILRRLHRRHEIHYVAFENSAFPEGLRRACEYSTRAYPLRHRLPVRGSLAFIGQMTANLFSSLPLPVSRYCSTAMRRQIDSLAAAQSFDAAVCDFIFPAPNFANLKGCILFQHNVEAVLWQRMAQQSASPLRRAYFGMQSRRMLDCEGRACREAGRVIAVSEIDAGRMRELYGAACISTISTGVDLDYFAPPDACEGPVGWDKPGLDKPGLDKPGWDKPGWDKPGSDKPGSMELSPVERGSVEPSPVEPGSMEPSPVEPGPVKPSPIKPSSVKPGPIEPRRDLVFVGSMDWMPNIDAVNYFLEEIFPRIAARRPGTTLAIVGRTPEPQLKARALADARITVTGTVPDVRPWLWGASLAIVPLRIGGGTRLKIYEAMAACLPVVSTSVGAEGLAVDPSKNIRLADDPEIFAGACAELLDDEAGRKGMARAAHAMVAQRFGWEHVAREFEHILEMGPRP